MLCYICFLIVCIYVDYEKNGVFVIIIAKMLLKYINIAKVAHKDLTQVIYAGVFTVFA